MLFQVLEYSSEQTGSLSSHSRGERQWSLPSTTVRVGRKATVAVDNSFQKYMLWNEEKRMDGSWGKEGFCFVFNMGDTRAYLCAAKWLPERKKVNIQKRKEVPTSSGSLKMRVGGMYLTSGAVTFCRRNKLTRGNSGVWARYMYICVYFTTEIKEVVLDGQSLNL